MKTKTLIAGLIGILLFSGCTETVMEVRYVCPDGDTWVMNFTHCYISTTSVTTSTMPTTSIKLTTIPTTSIKATTTLSFCSGKDGKDGDYCNGDEVVRCSNGTGSRIKDCSIVRTRVCEYPTGEKPRCFLKFVDGDCRSTRKGVADCYKKGIK